MVSVPWGANSLFTAPLPALFSVQVLVVNVYSEVIFVNLLGFVLMNQAQV